MNSRVWKVPLAIIAGVVVSLFAIGLVQYIDAKYIAKTHYDNSWTLEQKQQYIDALPTSAFLLLLFAYIFGSFFGGYTAARITNYAKIICGVTVGFFLFLAGIINFYTLRYPIWVVISCFVCYILFSYIGALLARGKLDT